MEKNKQRKFDFLISVGFFLLFFIFFRFVTIQPGDDEIFIGLQQQYSFGEFLRHYYLNWSGRLFNNSLVYIFAGLPIIYWQLFMSLMIIVFGRTITYYIYPISTENTLQRKFIRILSYLGIFLLSSAVLIPGVFWLTGSLNYMVPVTFALLAFVPFFRLLTLEDKFTKKFKPIYIIPVILASLSNEQVSIGLWLITSGVLLLAKFRRIVIPRQLILLNFLIILFSIVSIMAPGNWLRIQQETQVWFSEYLNFNLFEKAILSFGFSLSTIINQWYYLTGLLWAVTAIIVFLKARNWFTYSLSILLLLFSVSAGLRFIGSLEILPDLEKILPLDRIFSFPYLLGPDPIEPTAILTYIFSSIGLVLLPISWIIFLKQNQLGIVLSYIFTVSILLIFAVGFSPTLFASGGRTGLVPNVLLLIILVRLFCEEKPFLILIAPTVVLILFKMLTLLHRWNSNGYFVDYGLITIPNLILH